MQALKKGSLLKLEPIIEQLKLLIRVTETHHEEQGMLVAITMHTCKLICSQVRGSYAG